MELKSFKGMPHELGGIDYTEGAEVEGGEYAVKIGTLGNEYIFDKESPEGDFLAKEYKKLNRNDRLLEDDPIALATFDQIARDQALTHAQRSVNEKGIDPFRNMYDEGQAKNGGVKYATGGPIGYNMDESAEDRMRTTAFGDQQMRIESETVNRKDIPAWKEAGLLMGDIFLTPVTSAFTGKSFSEMAMADSPYRSSEATRKATGDDTQLGTAFGFGFAESEGVISNLGTQVMGGMKDGGALPKDKYAQGGVSGQKDMYMGGGAWMQLFEGIHNLRQGSKQLAGPAIDQMIAEKAGEEYVRQPIAGPPTTTGGGSLGVPQRQPQEEQGGLDPQYFDQQGNPWMMDEGQLTNMPVSSESPDMITGDTPIDLGGSSAFGGFGGFKSGGAKKGVYGYYANGGGKKTDPPIGVSVTPTGNVLPSNQMSLDNRGVGSTDYGIIPANLEQYFYTLLGGNKQFTERDMTPEEYKALVKLYNLRKEPNTIGYPDHDKAGSTDIVKTGMLTKLINEPDIIRNLIGKADVKDGYITTDYNFGNKSLLNILKDPNVPDFMAWLHNNSPFVDSEAMAKKDAVKIKMPKNRK